MSSAHVGNEAALKNIRTGLFIFVKMAVVVGVDIGADRRTENTLHTVRSFDTRHCTVARKMRARRSQDTCGDELTRKGSTSATRDAQRSKQRGATATCMG
jgi:hypothetical protein